MGQVPNADIGERFKDASMIAGNPNTKRNGEQ